MKTKLFHYHNNMTTIFWVVVLLFFVMAVSCTKSPDVGNTVVLKDRSKMPKMSALDVTTVISDSGVTRYRISAPVWDVYDKSNQPYWEFPKGLHVEKFDENLKVDANINCNYARFNQSEQLWILKGKVRMMNLKGELFETERLFWNQREQKIYSDTLVKITQATHIINAVGFESNQEMSRYVFKETKGIFPVEEK